MNNLLVTSNIVFPIFLVMLIGFLSRRFGLMNEETVKGCNKLVFRVFLPVSLCRSIMRVDSSFSMSGGLPLFAALGTLAVFAVCMLVIPRIEPENSRRGVMIQGIFRSNYAIFGIPLAQALYPQGDGGVAAMMVVAVIPVFNILAVVALEIFRGGKFDLKRIVLGVLKNPLIWGCLIGFVVMKTGLKLPSVINSTVDSLASLASPLALFALGASLKPGKMMGNAKALLVSVGAKLVIVPAAALIIAYAIGWRGPEFATLMIVFGSPTAVSSFTMAEQMGGDGDLAAQQVVLTTVFSAVTIFLMIFLFKTWGIL
ncbi:MAG: AEC family transporter [Clostridia bacterium]|nr:AEC family transporter [Clostridia bacterium]